MMAERITLVELTDDTRPLVVEARAEMGAGLDGESGAELVANVSRILPFSCVDGPGNRMVIFLQGCNFNCGSCHNPHTIKNCNHCGDCVATCPTGALSVAGGVNENAGKTDMTATTTHKPAQKAAQKPKVLWQPELCTNCDKCLEVCSYQSSPKISRYTVAQLLELLLPRAAFLSGVTVSGGEASMQLDFVVALFKAIKSHDSLAHLSCYIDTNGHLAMSGWQQLMPYLDGAMVDVKAWDESVHKTLTGRSHRQVFASIACLAAANKLAEVRLLHIPAHSDFEHWFSDVGQWLAALPPDIIIRLNGFRRHGVRGSAATWPECTKAQMAEFRQGLIAHSGRDIAMPFMG
ncbi:4Fe-4S cluster-binding domain-containing protein [Shewanella sp. SNU WT4]|uniref:4Fe-4S cluster-binding domain-containing protein n=1 Tax=Shewanella sp. SNU WT4 TaxID=2590015 RepID=UPI00197D2AE2|nr:4Fe-4S cluster-binding domain-containing protein [Shewanella sp. SNU WT4]